MFSVSVELVPILRITRSGDVLMAGVERSFLIEDAAELLGLSRRTVYYRIRDGRLATIRTRGGSQRVLMSSIERLLREMRGLPCASGSASPRARDAAATDRAAAV